MADQLDTYRKKRDFSITPEPAGKPRKRKSPALSFVIQKHAATRLHYDFRLELDGVLKSWAVTRGPSLDPADKRLAVHVEDHPLEYGSFEGTIPAGEYGGGSVLLWDRGTWTPDGDPHKAYAKGHLDFTLDGEKLHGRWHLVRMRGKPKDKADNWLLIKSDDDYAQPGQGAAILEEQPRSVETQRTIEEIGGDKKSRRWHSGRAARGGAPAKENSPKRRAAAPLDDTTADKTPEKKRAAEAAGKKTKKSAKPKTDPGLKLAMPKKARRAALPRFVEPELATLSASPPSTEGFLHEVKFDGYRMQGALHNGRTVLRTRKGLDWTARFQPIADAISQLPVKAAVFDGEIVVEDANGVADFAALQKALSENDTGGALAFYVFDLVHLDGQDLTKAPLVERKALLKQILNAVPAPSPLRYSEHFDRNGDLMLKHICRLSAEGIVSKRADSPYRSGRGTDWIKSKCSNRQEFVILGFVPSTAVKKAIGSLVVGYYSGDDLVHAGRVGTGFSSDLAKDLYRDLEGEKRERSPVSARLPTEARKNVVWVDPKRVAEVEFRGWTGGDLLRQASFKGLREDKDPREIIREEPSAKTAEGARPRPSRGRDPAGRSPPVRLTHPDRVLWPEAGVTKQGLADYYSSVWPQIEKHISGRPLALVRCPTGIGHCFFQKHAWDGMADGIVSIRDPRDAEALVGLSSLEGLLGLVQASVLEIHPWGATVADLDHPDRLTFDLDPGEGVPWEALVAGAREVRQRLADAKLESFVKTTGGKGLHVVVPLTPSADWEQAKTFCHQIADAMAADSPDTYVSTMSKKIRTGRIYVDYLRNGRGATAVAAFSTRARASCGISTPVSFEELDEIGSGDRFTLDTIGRRLDSRNADPWADFFRVKQKLGDAATVTSSARKKPEPKKPKAKVRAR